MKRVKAMILRIIFLACLVLAANVYAETFIVSGDPEKGKEIFKNKGCAICHSINRVGGAIGPDLTQVTIRRTDERLVNWLKDPPSLLKDTDMPKVPWESEQEIFDLIAYFKTVKKDMDKSFLGKVSKKEAGKRLVKEYDCKSCHRIKDPESGRERFPDLTHEARKRNQKWLDKWLKDPQAVKSGTFMPTYPLTDEERAAIVEYLSTLK
ncbi:MAG: hypothetical protein A3G39_03455 [Deltaproteobacteria bacterium RIFCSPLOWO2_12_FULL_43_16]|nr:MAG: hypothetical protein A2Z89_10850 [Deltaproteobacteria bacterium GWA2_43_19]OGQ10353.1 MAG: hypothetical protein A3D30_04645 [Deltaproteobacteria bacterium RIFCSPHIGHO2_02_FULL_43_33]OGQ36371.1 MAG: hypothetical protein A3A85_02280 [Deltaproteobacteria bacterium RIFCSPLOWO2_01_FULL_42_9]OGQ61778.1 MAG: hypothetical protein A3G39_03455 [Deltaproteobacteria bacterium RIFCSPLOWO2_12_FULL_43_16]HBR17433.1 hypothetical protein [Deltaproteobacteria bacterium]